MVFLDTNVFIHHVGGAHRLRDEARALVADAVARREVLVTSAEVLQELLHVYMRAGRADRLSSALALVYRCVDKIWAVEEPDVLLAVDLSLRHPGLEARDLVHLACCIRRGPGRLATFDRALAAAWQERAGPQLHKEGEA